MSINTYRFEQFIEDARTIVGQGHTAEKTVEALRPLLDRLVSRPDCVTDLGRSASPEKTFEIYASATLSIQCIVWRPDVRAAAHNHNGWAVIGVVEGLERNTPYRRLDDGSKPWHAELERQAVLDVKAGETCVLVPPHDIHSVEIPEGKTVAIHVYGNDLKKQWRCRFDVESGEVTPFRPPPGLGLPAS